MSDVTKQNVDPNSAEFKEGVEARSNSTDDTKKWQAGNELGQELKDVGEKKAPVLENRFKDSPAPLFLRDRSDGKKGNAQDEKDEMEE